MITISRFFKKLTRAKPALNQAALTEVKLTFDEIKKLQPKNSNADKLTEALNKIDRLEEKYPFCAETARYYRGKISSDLINKLDNNSTYSNNHNVGL